MATNLPSQPVVVTQHTFTQSTSNDVPTNVPTRKTLAGAASGTVVGALTTIAAYFVFEYAFPSGLNDDLKAAILTLIASGVTTLASFAGSYLTPHAPAEGVQTQTTTRTVGSPVAGGVAVAG